MEVKTDCPARQLEKFYEIVSLSSGALPRPAGLQQKLDHPKDGMIRTGDTKEDTKTGF